MSNLMKGHKSMGHVAASFAKPRVAPRRGTPLPDEIRRDAEELFGEDFSDVRVIVSDAAPKIGAIAFTTGSEIHIAPGVYRPGTEATRALLGHELAHVVQQRRGRATNPHGYGVAVVRDQGLEAEADRMGSALQMMMMKKLQRTASEQEQYEKEEKEEKEQKELAKLLMQLEKPKPGEYLSKWMADCPNLTFKQIIMPGSHDAAMYEITDTQNMAWMYDLASKRTITQSRNIGQQLRCGTRFFDLRVYEKSEKNGGPTTGHFSELLGKGHADLGAYGPRLESVLFDVGAFIFNKKTEVVLLRFSHIKDDYVKTVSDMTAKMLKKFYYTKGTDLSKPISEYGGCVLPLFDHAQIKEIGTIGGGVFAWSKEEGNLQDGVMGITGAYSNSKNVQEVMRRQYANWTSYRKSQT